MSKRVIDGDLARIPLFRQLSKSHLRAVSGLATKVTVEPGRVLIREGEPGSELFLVVDGTAEVRRGDATIATRGPGDFFGEISLLLERPRTASVVAQTEMAIDVIGRREFKQLLADNPQLYEPLLQAVVERLVDVDPSIP